MCQDDMGEPRVCHPWRVKPKDRTGFLGWVEGRHWNEEYERDRSGFRNKLGSRLGLELVLTKMSGPRLGSLGLELRVYMYKIFLQTSDLERYNGSGQSLRTGVH